MGNKAARIGDNHSCPRDDPPAHVGGPILGGSPDVITGGQSQARVGDTAHCDAPLDDKIIKGSDTVFVNGIQAARCGDLTDGGMITGGCTTVFIGDSGGGSGGSSLANAAQNGTPFPDDPFVTGPMPTTGDEFAPAGTSEGEGDAGSESGASSDDNGGAADADSPVPGATPGGGSFLDDTTPIQDSGF